ncbi:unnamed protein product [Lupinus luteus]|uniref:Alkane hydroxylase MAH1-like n=1 Tax=Lupinus luteus TaxID=3873 RepID=A0AAV1X7J1_LUPLU
MTMAIVGYVAIFVALFCFLYFFHRKQCCKTPLLIDWPIFGMLPLVLINISHAHDFISHRLIQLCGTGEFLGPWFTKMNYLVTSDPSNVHHIMSKSFDNYVKGPEFRDIFQPFGDGIFTADSETWKYSRSLFHSLFRQKRFELFLEKTIQKKVHNSLLPILDHAQQQGTVIDLQDVFNRFTFDNICSLVLGYDPNCLSIEFPEVAYEKAFNEAEESIFYRHIVPKSVWKLQEWLQIGQEKTMKKSCKVFDQFIYACIKSKREEIRKQRQNGIAESDDDHVDFLTTLISDEKGVHDNIFLRDATFNLFVAGRDTITSALTWFFWLVAKNPIVETKILEEIKQKFGSKDALGIEEVKKLVYLHGALCEAMRLFPPIPFERKQAINGDTLPSGHYIKPKTMILFSLYSMARFESIWGKDCLEFKPERWISERGSLIHVPSYKFFSFNAGPRTCLGKDLSFIQMKMVATSILSNFSLHLLQGHDVIPSLSIVLLMKNGFKVMIKKR